VDGRPVLEPYAADRMRDGAHGAPLIPWPNRLEDGRYSFDGTTYQVPLTEPEKRNAIHGFLLWQPWETTERDPDRLVMKTHLYPRDGYPFTLGIRISYELGPNGLTVATTAENIGDRACSYGHGHPYLSPGCGHIDACRLQLSGSTRIVTDSERQLPTGREPVEGTDFDFLAAKPGRGSHRPRVHRSRPRRGRPGVDPPLGPRRGMRGALGRWQVRLRRDLYRRHPRPRPRAPGPRDRADDLPAETGSPAETTSSG
jgi:galactose mutarotase-like enzyme